jgi:hypothetical protein
MDGEPSDPKDLLGVRPQIVFMISSSSISLFRSSFSDLQIKWGMFSSIVAMESVI